MDGVLTDSEPAFYAAINDVLATYGCHVGMNQYAPLIGSATPFTWSSLIEWFSLPVPLVDVIEEFEPFLQARLAERRDALPGARELVETLRSRSVPVALCTASYMRWVEPILEGAGLTGLFDVLSTADMVERTKPDPAPYVHAAKLLGFAPAECVAIEDSRNGLESALGAGCWTVQLRATETAAAPHLDARLLIHSLAEFPLGVLGG
jgi:HAD superfamily hydrolase (TIGR01509 family)